MSKENKKDKKGEENKPTPGKLEDSPPQVEKVIDHKDYVETIKPSGLKIINRK